MRRTAMAMAIVALAFSPAAGAQEKAKAPSTDAQAESAPPSGDAAKAEAAPRRQIRVLQHPYDLSSFYRGQSSLGPWAGLPNDPSYRIAGFYRSHQGGYPSSAYGWSAFWTNGYSAPRPAPFPGYRRTIGENGDLFLLVPFLAPVGPINSAFLGY